jgi:hypothetical protein
VDILYIIGFSTDAYTRPNIQPVIGTILQIDKNEKGYLDLHSFLIAMEKQKKPI